MNKSEMMEEMKMMEWKWIELRFENIHQWDSEFHEWFPFYYKHKLVSPSASPADFSSPGRLPSRQSTRRNTSHRFDLIWFHVLY